jgi:hypothetical protein
MDLRQSGRLDSALFSAVQHIPLAPAEFFHASSRLPIQKHNEPGAIAEEHWGKESDAAVGATILLHHPYALA